VDGGPAAAHVGGPLVQRDREIGVAYLAEDQRRVELAAHTETGEAACLTRDMPGERGDQRGGLSVVPAQQAHRAMRAKNLGDVDQSDVG
jgi:hypothetical protein